MWNISIAIGDAMILGRRNMEVLGAALALHLAMGAAARADVPARTLTPSSGMTILAENDWDKPDEVAGPPALLADRPDAASATETTTATATDPPAGSTDGQSRVLPPRGGGKAAQRSASATTPPDVPTRPWYRSGPAALAVVLAAIVGVAWLARRYVPSVKKMADGPLKVVGRAYLSPKQSVALVQVGRRHVLVGVTSDRLTNLGHIADADESFHLKVEAARPDPVSTGNRFEELLATEAAEYAEFESGPPPPSDNPSQLRETMGELRSLMGRLRTLQGPKQDAGLKRGED
jgi:flagellar biosynthetic protein FliO